MFLTRAKARRREEARARAEAKLNAELEGRRKVLSELNTKAQTYGTIQAGTTALFFLGVVTLMAAPRLMVAGIVCLGVGMVLSLTALGMLRWMVVTGTKKARRPKEDIGLRALQESRLDEYARNNKKNNEITYVAEKRRRLFRWVAVIAILGDIVAFGWAIPEAITYFLSR